MRIALLRVHQGSSPVHPSRETMFCLDRTLYPYNNDKDRGWQIFPHCGGDERAGGSDLTEGWRKAGGAQYLIYMAMMAFEDIIPPIRM